MLHINFTEIEATRRELVCVTRKLYERGLCAGTSGNTSARVPNYSDWILIKKTGKCCGEVESEDFLLIDLEGNILDGEGEPSTEVNLHCGIYKVRPDVSAIIHDHSPYATAYATARNELPIVTAAEGLSEIGIIGYEKPGSLKLASAVAGFFQNKTVRSSVLVRHGVITVGASLSQAYYLADVVETNAKMACILAQISSDKR